MKNSLFPMAFSALILGFFFAALSPVSGADIVIDSTNSHIGADVYGNGTPSPSLPLFFNLGVQGYVGKREGVTGSLQVKFEF